MRVRRDFLVCVVAYVQDQSNNAGDMNSFNYM